MTGALILLLAAVFLIAAISKLRSMDAFRAALRGVFPSALVEPIAVVVPMAELVLAAFLLSGINPQKAAGCAIVVLAVFTMVLSVMWRRGIKGCACFGESVNTATTGSGIARNIFLIAAAVLVARGSGPAGFWGPDISTVLGRLTVVAGALSLWSCALALVNQRQIFFNNSNNLP